MPRVAQGAALTLMLAGILSLAFMGFAGLGRWTLICAHLLAAAAIIAGAGGWLAGAGRRPAVLPPAIRNSAPAREEGTRLRQLRPTAATASAGTAAGT
ncbi:MAG: hypothetical protein MZV65_17665 [Chromatiales bacterium]|nr:hypothetical protein [Chromatiales bacterium]